MEHNYENFFFPPDSYPVHLTGHLKDPIDEETASALERVLANSPKQLVEVTWNGLNKQHYIALGYPFSKYGETILVSPFHLTPQAHRDVWVSCEVCYKVKPLQFGNLIKNLRGKVKLFTCTNCKVQKIKQSNIVSYGVPNPMQLTVTQEKVQSTVLENHGVKNVMHDTGIKKKLKETNMNRHGVLWYTGSRDFQQNREQYMMDKHGVTSPLQKPEFLEKARQTSLERYGKENPFQNKEIREKAAQTLKNNHGVSHPFQIPGVSEKAAVKRAETLKNNGNGVKTSLSQLYIAQLLNVPQDALNHLVGSYFLDIALNRGDLQIDLEYNGFGHYFDPRFGHMTWEEFEKKERKRFYALKQKGWILIRIVNKEDDMLPQDEILLHLIEHAIAHLEKGHSWFEINLTTSCLSYHDHNGNKVNEQVVMGEKRKINSKAIKGYWKIQGQQKVEGLT
jgi:hypothetical protein